MADETATVHDQLRAAYEQSGQRLVDVVTKSGVSESTVLNAFRGRNVTKDNLFALASTLGIEALKVP